MGSNGIIGGLDNAQTSQSTGKQNIGIINQQAARRTQRNNVPVFDKLPFHDVTTVIAKKVNCLMFIQISKCFWSLMLLQVRRGCTGNHPDVTKTSGYKTRILKRTQADKAIYAFRNQISFFIGRNQHNFNTWIQCLKMPEIRD